MRLLLLFSLLVTLFLLSSCKKYQPADPSFFVKSGTISVATTSKEGSGSHKITDLWMYVNGKYQGTYPTGNLMPINFNKLGTSINIFAGIKNNGIADTRIFYPFFDFLTFDTLVDAGKVIERSFTFKYKTATVFEWKENFDFANGISIKNISADATMDIAPADDSFENKSLRVTLPSGGVLARIESSNEGFKLPLSTSNVYLEINYKCNTAFTIGITDGTRDIDAIVVNEQGNWNKIYVQLSTAVNTLLATKCKVYFQFTKSPNSTETKQIFLDNIKLLYL